MPDLTTGTESDGLVGSENEPSGGSDSGYSEEQFGDPTGEMYLGIHELMSVGISGSSEFDSTNL